MNLSRQIVLFLYQIYIRVRELATVSCVMSVFLMHLTQRAGCQHCGLAQRGFPDKHQPYSQFHLSFLHLFPFCFILK